VNRSALVALLVFGARAASAEQPDRAAFDLYVFSQADEGGHPFRDESFLNNGVRTDLRIAASSRVAIWHNASFAILNNADPTAVPATIGNGTTLSASGVVLYLDSAGGIEWTSEDGNWIFTPGIYYHHQSSIIAGGADVVLQHLMAGGDTTLILSYSFRLGFRKLYYWDGTEELDHSHPTPSHTLLFGWTQTLSPSWRMALNAIYARQTGVLSNTFGYVTLFDQAGVPRHLVDELLPTTRNRFQLNGRLRWSPEIGLGIGLDASGYADDWGVKHFAVEPNFEIELGEGLRLRAWYRFSAQGATKYFRLLPTTIARFQTQDSDLGSFAMHSPGMELTIGLPDWADLDWHLRIGGFGFWRTDGIFAVGGHTGVVTEW